MKTILLAGGLGSRLSEYTDAIPKPMVPIGGKPILWHIMNLYAQYKKTSFCVFLYVKFHSRLQKFSQISNRLNFLKMSNRSNYVNSEKSHLSKKYF